MKTKITLFGAFKNTLGAIAIFATSSVYAQTNVFDDVIATSPDHNYLEAALVQEGLDVALQTSPELTVFAPTDQAFTDIATALGTDINGLLELPNLADILTYHVLGAVVPSSAVTNGLIAQPLSATNTLKLTVNSAAEVYVNQAKVTAVDLSTDNGVVHVIDGVVLPVETVVDVAIDNGFNALASAVIASELMPVLTNPLATYTVFAPTDQAFQNLADLVGVPLSQLFDPTVIPTSSLQAVLGTHVLGSIVPAAAVTNGAIVDNIVGINTLKLTVKGSGEVFVNQAQVTTVDVNSDNGVVHIINSVLLPDETVVDVAIDNGFSTLATAVITAELMPALTDPYNGFTVFAPTNEAFDDLATALGTDLNGILALPNLADVLLYHVVGGVVLSTDLMNGNVPTLNGADVTVDLTNGVMINEAMVTGADVLADNGVVHIIDKVLLPGAGISEESIEISIYPNPAKDKLYINSTADVDFYITDMTGAVVKRGTTGVKEVSVSDLNSGAYLIHTSTSQNGQVYRFIKQ